MQSDQTAATDTFVSVSTLCATKLTQVAPYKQWSVQCSVASSGEDRHDELLQQEQAMAAFMDSFAANKAARLAELEAMQVAAGSARQLLPDRTNASDMPPIPFDESQARPLP